MAVARAFSACSAYHSYMFLYLLLCRRIHIGQLRSRLRQLNINTRCIPNIHRHLVALLIHNDYKVELRSQLKKFMIPVQDDYDPLDPSNLCYSDYDDWDKANRTSVMCVLSTFCIFHALDYIKGPVKQAVANFFAKKGYIDRNEYLDLFSVKKGMSFTYCFLNSLPFFNSQHVYPQVQRGF